MTKAKWVGALSTTTHNHIGLIQVRMHNVNSETFEFNIVDGNGELYDLTNRKVLFCTYFDKFAPVEQYAKVISKGKIQYTMNKHDMQQPVRINFAYFKIMEENGDVVDTTQNFSYNIIRSIESTCMDSEPYIIRLEEVLDAFANVRDEAMKEIQTIINNFNQQVIQQQQDFDQWFDSVREIIESIDPGGLLLSEIIDARKNNVINVEFTRLKDRLNFSDSILFSQVPSGFKFIIEHTSEYQPNITVTSYRNALGTEAEGLGTGPSFGGETIYNVPTHLSYDRHKAYIEMPLFYALNGEISQPTKNVLLIIDGINTLCFTIEGADIVSGAYPPNEEPTTILRIPEALEVTAIDDTTIKLTWKKGE